MTTGTPCPACSSVTRRLHMPLERATIAICPACGHGATVASARRIGAEQYAVAPEERAAYERDYLPARLRSYERGLRLLGPADGRVLLDIGSNYGHFLAFAARHGWRTLGVEPGDALRAHAVDGTAAVGSLEEAAERAPFDAVTLWDVLEHLPAPDRYIERLEQLLAPGGRILLRVPDARVFGALRASLRWRAAEQAYLTLCHPTNPEEHISHFTPGSVARMAGAARLQEAARIDAVYDERVFAARTPLDGAVRRALHRAGARLPYEFTMTLERRNAP
jgi:SAM-dependent methyltransferase